MKEKSRRSFIAKLGLGISSVITFPLVQNAKNTLVENMNPIKEVKPLGFQWETLDPFLFCVHHEDFFPKGNDVLGPDDSMEGRHLGDDFIIKNGYRMYHGKTVPGFPGHPHRGFETITVVRKGMVDHADSMGASGRYGNGDVQWMTAGKGVQHSEMFPLLKKEEENPLELFQIWLNLPKKNKMVNPHFKMLWSDDIPNVKITDKNNKTTTVEVIAGKFNEHEASVPPPDSWAADSENEVAVWNILMEKNASFTLPKTKESINRTIYFYEGDSLTIHDQKISNYHSIVVDSAYDLTLTSGDTECSILVLQGKPIGEPVMQYGPFVMNTKEEIKQAFNDYNETQFGGWPWPKYDQVHDKSLGRFAKHADGKLESKG